MSSVTKSRAGEPIWHSGLEKKAGKPRFRVDDGGTSFRNPALTSAYFGTFRCPTGIFDDGLRECGNCRAIHSDSEPQPQPSSRIDCPVGQVGMLDGLAQRRWQRVGRQPLPAEGGWLGCDEPIRAGRLALSPQARVKPTGRANARPMTGSAKPGASSVTTRTGPGLRFAPSRLLLRMSKMEPGSQSSDSGKTGVNSAR